MNRELSRLVSRGCGQAAANLCHVNLGTGIWQYSSKGFEIAIFDQGIVVKSNDGLTAEVKFSEIIGVQSSLNAVVLAEASASNAFDIDLPLILDLSGQQIKLSVPLVIYSALLITIQEMRLSNSKPRPA